MTKSSPKRAPKAQPKTWWVSDTHFFHRNIIKYSKRPFAPDHEFESGQISDASVAAMNEAMVERWNARVAPRDTVWHLGDFALSSNQDAVADLAQRLNGEINLIIGNHDPAWVRKLPRWRSVQPYKEIRSQGRFIVMSHYAMRVWNKSHYGSIMLDGHSHGTLPGCNQSLDVGVDDWDYAPVSLDEILARLKTLQPYTGFSDPDGEHGVAKYANSR